MLNVTVICVTTILGNTSQFSKCTKTICPPVKATLCVKIKQKNGTLPMRHVMMSKCEVRQIKCLNDVKTTVVPVKFCNAPALREGRLIDEDVNGQYQSLVADDKNEFENDKTLNANEENKSIDPDNKILPEDTREASHEDPNEEGDTETPPLESDVTEATDVLSEEKKGDPNKKGDPEMPPPESDVTDATEMPTDEKGEPDDLQVTHDDSNRDPHFSEIEHEEDITNNEGACPHKCPTRDVMVCARCSHKIYRTFMSACYMRMYQCRNPKEKLELVSRHACIGSAPYLGEMSRPSKNLVEAQDNDPVLSYIFAA